VNSLADRLTCRQTVTVQSSPKPGKAPKPGKPPKPHGPHGPGPPGRHGHGGDDRGGDG
jgi:hypothetical protein